MNSKLRLIIFAKKLLERMNIGNSFSKAMSWMKSNRKTVIGVCAAGFVFSVDQIEKNYGVDNAVLYVIAVLVIAGIITYFMMKKSPSAVTKSKISNKSSPPKQSIPVVKPSSYTNLGQNSTENEGRGTSVDHGRTLAAAEVEESVKKRFPNVLVGPSVIRAQKPSSGVFEVAIRIINNEESAVKFNFKLSDESSNHPFMRLVKRNGSALMSEDKSIGSNTAKQLMLQVSPTKEDIFEGYITFFFEKEDFGGEVKNLGDNYQTIPIEF